jgi:hypothetical protein
MTRLIHVGAILLAAACCSGVAAAQTHTPPPLQLTDQQREMIRDAVMTEHVAQPTPKGFEARAGAALPTAIKGGPLPRPLVYQIEALKHYYYAKIDHDLLIIDPMNKKVVEVIPRKSPASGEKPVNPSEWSATRGRELLGLPPATEGHAANQ